MSVLIRFYEHEFEQIKALGISLSQEDTETHVNKCAGCPVCTRMKNEVPDAWFRQQMQGLQSGSPSTCTNDPCQNSECHLRGPGQCRCR